MRSAEKAYQSRNVLFPHYRLQRSSSKGIAYCLSLVVFFIWVLIERPDVVHWHELKIYRLEYYLVRCLKRQSIRCLLSVHDVLHHEKKAAPPVLGKLYRLFDGVIVHANDSRRLLLELFGIDSDRVHVIPVGEYSGMTERAPTDKAASRHELDLSPGNKVILFFGYIRRYKGLDLLLKAMPTVLRSLPETVLMVVGESKERFQYYEQLVSRLGIHKAVRAVPTYIPIDRVKLYFSASDVVALPYRNIYQSGVVHLAFAYHRPVIATRVGGLPEVVRHGVDGFIVPPEDPKALAETLVRALSNPHKLETMGEAAFLHSQNTLSWDWIAGKTVELYNATLSKSKPR